MPKTDVIFYQEADDDVPVLDWLNMLRKNNRKAWARCTARIRLLEEFGHELRRPHADSIGLGLYELPSQGKVHYRILYGFHGQDEIPLLCGFAKEGKLPESEIQRALERKAKFDSDPKGHTYRGGGSAG